MKPETEAICKQVTAKISAAGGEIAMKNLAQQMGLRAEELWRLIGFLVRGAKADTYTANGVRMVRLREV